MERKTNDQFYDYYRTRNKYEFNEIIKQLDRISNNSLFLKCRPLVNEITTAYNIVFKLFHFSYNALNDTW